MLDGAGELSSTEPPIEFVKVHPMAAIFPMLPDDELAELAEDIRANGLLHPIIVDDDGELIDGRNRLSACKIAGVEPQYRIVRAEDALTYIASANLNRRHLSKSQQAIARAIVQPEAKRGRPADNVKKLDIPGLDGSERQMLSQARVIVGWSSELAEDVLAGRKEFSKAFEQAKRERAEAEIAKGRLAELRLEAPDLADLVEDERLSLDDAWAKLTEQREDAELAEANKRTVYLRLCEAASKVTALANKQFIEGLCARLEADEEFRTEWQARVRFAAEHPDELKPGVNAFAKLLKHYGGP